MPSKTSTKTASKKPAKKVAHPASKKPTKLSAKPAPSKTTKAKPAKAPKPATAASTPSAECQLRSLANMKTFFERTLASLEEGDSAFTPMPGMFNAAQQVAHTAQTVDWFLDGAFSPRGFDVDFPALEAEVRKVSSLAAAKKWLDEAFGRLEQALKERPASAWGETIIKETVMGGAPRWTIIDGLADHTAHHRGSLAVYARLRGKTPAMPYM